MRKFSGAVMYACLIPSCTKKLWNLEERRKHHKQHMVGGNFFCYRLGCGKKLRTLKALIRHDKEHEQRFECKNCHRSFRAIAALLRHQKLSCKAPSLFYKFIFNGIFNLYKCIWKYFPKHLELHGGN